MYIYSFHAGEQSTIFYQLSECTSSNVDMIDVSINDQSETATDTEEDDFNAGN